MTKAKYGKCYSEEHFLGILREINTVHNCSEARKPSK